MLNPKTKMAHTSSIMDAPIGEISEPVMKPTPFTTKIPSLRRLTRNYVNTLAKKVKANAKKVINKFADWILSLPKVPIRRGINEMEAPLRVFLRTYRIDGIRGQDQNTFTNYVRPRVLNFFRGRQRPFQVKFIFTCKFQKGATEEEKVDIYGYFHTHVERIMEDTDLDELYERMIRECLEKIESLQKEGSGLQFASVESLDVNIDPLRPMGGNSYFPPPYKLAVKKAIINVKNDDNECFKWAVASAIYRSEVHPERVNNKLINNAAMLDWKGIDFPTPLQQISRFEKQNPYSINVYGWTGTSVYPLRISKHDNKQCINLMLLEKKGDHHYCWIKNMSALTASQYNKHKGKRFVCKYCCNSFQWEVSLQNHIEYCSKQKAVKVVMPKKGETLQFKNHHRKMRVPFVVYADFECFTRPISTCAPSNEHSYTQQYQKHKPCSYSYYIKCFDDELFPPVLKRYTIEDENTNVAKSFVKSLEEDIVDIYDQFKGRRRRRITKKETRDFEKATICHICEGSFGKTENERKVRDHCHLTGRYGGAAHNKCNLEFKLPKFYPVIFHNLEKYDAHLFIKELAEAQDPLKRAGVTETNGGIGCIARTEENYVSFRKEIVVDVFFKDGKWREVKREIRFIDSLKFMNSSLEKLAGNLTSFPDLEQYFKGDQLELVKRKGVYPYDYMNCIERLGETSLPPIECFYSKLNDTNISKKDYAHAQLVWETFQMKTMKDYHDLYLQTDVLLLSCVFEEFRNICLKHYKLDPAWYYTTPGLAWDACLKMTKVELELLHDQDMLLMVEKGTFGGVSMISTRYGKANNKYMSEYNPSKPSKYIAYLDANNLYGWAMSKPLPTHGFRRMCRAEIDDWEHCPCILEVDLEYPIDLHDLHSDYPLAPDHLEVGGVEKLIPNFYNKKQYVVHHEVLKTYIKYGLKIRKIHGGITFHESPWMKPYIEKNTKLRMLSKNNFESDFFKLMNNSVFGKTMENIRNRVDIKLVTTPKQTEKYIYRSNYTGRTAFSDDLVAIHMAKTSIYMNKPKYLGMCILGISKTLMYDFHYGYVKPKYGEKAKLLFTDTDSLKYEIETEDFYKYISQDVHEWFDTSNYPKEHQSGIPTGVNKKVIGMFKDEVGGKIITEFVGLRAKNYSYVCDGKEYKKCKGIKINVTKKDISHKDYKNCLFNNVQLRRRMNVFRSHKHVVYSEEINKIALSANDDNRIILEDGIHTRPHGWSLQSYV